MSDITLDQTILSFFISLVVALILVVIKDYIEKRKYLKREKFELYKELRNDIGSIFSADDFGGYMDNLAKKKKKKKDEGKVLSFEVFEIKFKPKELLFYHTDSMAQIASEDIFKEKIIPHLRELNDLSVGKIRKLTKKILEDYDRFCNELTFEKEMLLENVFNYNPVDNKISLVEEEYLDYLDKTRKEIFYESIPYYLKKLHLYLDKFIKP